MKLKCLIPLFIFTGLALVWALQSPITTWANSFFVWQTVGNANFTPCEADEINLKLDKNNTPYLAFDDGVMKYDGSAWVPVGTVDCTKYTLFHPSLAFDKNNTLYMAYEDVYPAYYKATVKKYNGTAWELVGAADFSTGTTAFMTLALDSNNTPYVAYEDGADGSLAMVKKYNGTAWVSVGVFSQGAYGLTMALDGNNTPYVAFTDYSHNLIVMKYTGLKWEQVGKMMEYFFDDPQYLSLAFDKSNAPYVGLKDNAGSVGVEAWVVKYDGTNWAPVGAKGVSASGVVVYYTKLAIDQNNTLNLAYEDGSHANKATVMRYDGVNWAPVGTAGFSAAVGAYTSMALDSGGNPYVAFMDYGEYGSAHTFKATVMKAVVPVLNKKVYLPFLKR